MGGLRRLVLRYVRGVARAQSDQAFFGRLRDLAQRGMNIGGGGDLATSGEQQVLDHVAALGLGAPVILDVGANLGAWSLAARRTVSADARILAFEPSTTACERLGEALAGTGVELVPLALGEAAGTATLHADADASGLGSLYARTIDHLDLKLAPVEEVRVERLDAVCAERGIERVALLKLDVEGHELAVLRGAGDMLASGAIDLVQFEFGGCNLDSRTYLRDFHRLLAPTYRILRILRHGFKELGPYRETDEVFTTTNYLACLRTGPAPAGVIGA